MERLMTAEESYMERRRLFKDIWTTGMNMDEKDTVLLNKPKVIKTLHLDSVDRSAGKRKKQKIRNLRTVCNKILDFCDKQEVDDLFYTQMIAEGNVSPPQQIDRIAKKQKAKIKTTVRKSKSMFSSNIVSLPARTITFNQKDQIGSNARKTTQKTSPTKLKPTSKIRKHVNLNKTTVKVTDISTMNSNVEVIRRKLVKKKISKRKKYSDNLTPPPAMIEE